MVLLKYLNDDSFLETKQLASVLLCSLGNICYLEIPETSMMRNLIL